MKVLPCSSLGVCFLFLTVLNLCSQGIVPTDAEGRSLNLGFESGDLSDWQVRGEAFLGQPVKGDTVTPRRDDMSSDHEGDYWIGTYEVSGDDPKGSLTSVPFAITHPYASFRLAGGASDATRVELVDAKDGKVFFKAAGVESENLRPVIVDLRQRKGQSMQIRVVDDQAGHWGHVNFDDFRFHAEKPELKNVLDPVQARKSLEMPVIDQVLFSGLEPQEAVEAMTLPEGFQAHVFAAEPDVTQPIAFCLDDRGRMWVAEGHQYPHRAEGDHGKDRILILEDTNGDHRFDVRKVFQEGLNLISGLEVGFGGVWVGAAPYLMFIPDRNGDDVPDAEPEILLDGWDPYRDTHETLNTFSWGPDGWLYGCHGVFCPSLVGKPGTPAKDRQRVDAAIWRYHPTRHDFEVFAEGTSNPWGLDFNARGHAFIEACVIPHFWHIIQGARYQRQGGQHYSISQEEKQRVQPFLPPNAPDHLHPFIYQDIQTHGDHVHWAGNKGPHAANNRSDEAGGGHAHAGLMMYQGGSWPEAYQDRAFMNNIHGQRINMDVPERKGSGYVGRHGPDFLNFNDRWSQVLNMLYDHNGSVYLVDWYDANQCHHRRDDGHDRSNGRIYKVVYDEEPWTPVDVSAHRPEGWVRLQLHPNEWFALQARKRLMEHGGNEATDTLLNRLMDEATDTLHRLRLMWTLGAMGKWTEAHGLRGMSHTDEDVRAWSIQLSLESRNPTAQTLKKLETLAAEDPSAMVRLYVASALQRTPVVSRFPVLKALVSHAEDAEDHNLPLMIWYAMEPVVGQDSSQGISLLQACKIPILREFITRRMATQSLVASR